MPKSKYWYTDKNGKYRCEFGNPAHKCDYCGQLVTFTYKTTMGGKCQSCHNKMNYGLSVVRQQKEEKKKTDENYLRFKI